MRSKLKDYFTPAQVQELIQATKYSRYPLRDRLILLLTYRHGLRASELCDLRLTDLNLQEGSIYIRRSKCGLSTTHPLLPDEIQLLTKYLLTHTDTEFLFLSDRGAPLTRSGIYQMIKALGRKLDWPRAHPHMLRHSTGYYLANAGHDIRIIQDYLGHRDIQSTVRYTKVNVERFRHLWQGQPNRA